MKKLLLIFFIALAFPAFAQQLQQGTALASAAQTTAQVNSSDLYVPAGLKGGHVIMNVSAYTSGNYTPKVQAQDPATGNWYDVCVGIAMSGTGTQVLKVVPGAAPIANAVCADVLPVHWRVQVNGLASPSMTFSVSYSLE